MDVAGLVSIKNRDVVWFNNISRYRDVAYWVIISGNVHTNWGVISMRRIASYMYIHFCYTGPLSPGCSRGSIRLFGNFSVLAQKTQGNGRIGNQHQEKGHHETAQNHDVRDAWFEHNIYLCICLDR